MRLTFQIRFHTQPGQTLWLTGPDELFGNGDPSRAVGLDYLNHERWQAKVFIPQSLLPDQELTYHYILREPDGSLMHDWGNDRTLNLSKLNCEELLVIDSWNHAGFFENVFFTEPFQEVLLKKEESEIRRPGPGLATHILKIKAPFLEKDQTLCLLGAGDVLGNWSTANPILLNRIPGQHFLSVELDLRAAAFPIVYKYGVYDVRQKKFIRFEEGNNRVLEDTIAQGKLTIVNDGFAAFPANTWKGAGVSVPVFSLRTEAGFGVGEFNDLKKLVDWCVQTGLKLIQILPVNDTTSTHSWTDSYPYAAISAFALHPLYLNLTDAADAKGKKFLGELEPERRRLNSLDAVDYEAVMQAKLGAAKELFNSQKDRTFRSKEYRQFFESNRDWLVPYSLFCYLRDQYGTADFTRWPAHRKYVSPAGQSGMAASLPSAAGASGFAVTDNPGNVVDGSMTRPPPVADEIAFHYFVQFHLHRQLSQAAGYAHEHGVILKGDIPIGVCRYGTDPWQAPELYQMQRQAGAPPDAFARKGQNWGFPTYNWQQMKQTDYIWWKRRFEQMSRYFDAFRIDHILGFFRIWSIPAHAVEGIMGHFVPARPVRVEEFAQRGLTFDRTRFLAPYISEQVVADICGAEADLVKSEYLDKDESIGYRLKPQFATQRQVEEHLSSLERNDRNNRIQEYLFDLISNVLLFEEENSNGERFHFRFGIETTHSFQALDPQTRAQLHDLYIDYYFRRQDEFWRKEAMEKLPALKRATNMLVCGEDLGLVPACVPQVMRDLGLLSLEIQRMPKTVTREFSRPQEAHYLSVVTPSTHDMNTIRAWWKEDRTVTQRFYEQELGQTGAAPEDGEPRIVGQVIRQHLHSPAMWSIFQIQDLFGTDEQLRRADAESERINVPANPRNYWRYRMHLPIEALIKANAFNEALRKQINESGR